MDFETCLDRYADLILQVGLNLQPGQRLLIGNPANPVPLEAADLVLRITEKAYQGGAPLVEVLWGDERLRRARVAHADPATLDEFSDWQVSAYVERIQAGDALLTLYGRNPDLYAGLDPARMGRLAQSIARHHRPVGDLVGVNATSWLVAGVPVPGWAAKVFPDEPVHKQMGWLWAAIFAACRLDQDDPIAAWEAHLSGLVARRQALTRRGYAALHYTAPGTDLVVGLPAGHIWQGGRENNRRGVPFAANLPTEEVFTLPHRLQVNGVVAATRPFNFSGGTIEGARLTFSAGRVVEFSAEQGEDLLRQVLDTDENARYLGEVALVPNSSPITQTGLIFHNILFDENAACHFAFGDSYRTCLTGGPEMSDADYTAAGGNASAVHLDFMIGSAHLNIDGHCADGTIEPLMRQGEWAFEVA